MNISGIDEAGLGPILGPYCASRVSFGLKNSINLFENLGNIISKNPNRNKIAVADSKVLYTSLKDITCLEESVLIFLYILTGSLPDNFKSFLKNTSVDIKSITVPELNNCESLKIPVSADIITVKEKAKKLADYLSSKDITLNSINVVLSDTTDFNNRIKEFGNKATVCQTILSKLLTSSFESENEENNLTVDRQGGRRYYSDWIMNLFPGRPLRIDKETKDLSSYQWKKNRICFKVKADSSNLEVALASMFAKYTRECSMILFNSYWSNKISDLKPTAGYYKDGIRFLNDLKKSNIYPKNDFNLKRRK